MPRWGSKRSLSSRRSATNLTAGCTSITCSSCCSDAFGLNAQNLALGTLMPDPTPLVGIIMGSKSDWETLRHAAEMLARFEVPHECRIVSAHRTPQWLAEYATTAEPRGLKVIIAG